MVRAPGRLTTKMKLLYKPFGIIAGLIAARLGHSVFKQIWSQIDDEHHAGDQQDFCPAHPAEGNQSATGR